MKNLIITTLVTLFSSSVFATGLKINVFTCDSLNNGPRWSLDYFSTSAPGGPLNEWHDLKYEAGQDRAIIRLQPKGQTQSSDSSLSQYVSQDPNGYGHLNVLKIGGKLFVDARLGNTFNGLQVNTNGLIELGEGYICTYSN